LERVLRYWQGQTRRSLVAIKLWSVEVVFFNVEMWQHSANATRSEGRNFQMTKKILEENSTKPTSIRSCLSVVLSCFSSKLLCWKQLNINELRRKLRVLVGLYKRLSEGGLLKKVISWISPARTSFFSGIKVP